MEPTLNFWNLSNHEIERSWPEAQKNAARKWAGVNQTLLLKDLSFPQIDPDLASEIVGQLAADYSSRLQALGCQSGEPILVQGEFTFVLAIVPLLQEMGLVPLCATSRRLGHEVLEADGTVTKSYRFEFVRFREYIRYPTLSGERPGK